MEARTGLTQFPKPRLADVFKRLTTQLLGATHTALALVSLMLMLASSLSAQTVSFIGTNYRVGGQGIAVADFNGDGKLDMAVASTSVTVMLGNGDGTFQTALNSAAGPQPSSIAVGDFNGDGKLDVAVTDASTFSIYILLGKGDGTFGPAQPFKTGENVNPVSIVVSDFNNDGKLDVAVADQGCLAASCTSGTVTVMLGNGDGTLQPPLHLTVGIAPNGLAVSDFNNDGVKDLAATDSNGNVWILLGNGTGTFQVGPPIALTGANTPAYGVAVGDFNGDGKPDLAVATGAAEFISILLGRGDGTFRSPQNISDPLAQVPAWVAVGDFNGDGKQDLAVALSECCNAPGEGVFAVLPGNGDGTFQSFQRFLVPGFTVPNASIFLVPADFNADKKLDLALVMSGVIGGTNVMMNTTGVGPAPFSLGSLTLSPATVSGGNNSTGNVRLVPGAVAPAGSQVIDLISSNTNLATVPSTATMIAGMNNVFFQILTSSSITSTTTASLTASVNNSVSATLTITPGTPSALASLTLNPTTVTSGTGSVGTVTLNEPAPAGDATITLSSSNTSVATVPATATVPAGQTTSSFSVTSGTVTTTQSATISASFGAVTKSVVFTVNPPSNVTVSSLTLNPTSVVGGNSSTGTVTLSGPAPSGGSGVQLASSSTVAIPSTVILTVPAGQTGGTFTISTSSVTATQSVTISATLGGVTQNATLTVTPPSATITLSSLTLNPTSVTGGSSSQGTVALSAAASAATSVTLSSSNSSVASVPASVTVAAGSTSATFTITTTSVTTSVTITASQGGVSKTATLTVTSASSTITLSSLTLNPTTVSGGNNSQGTVVLSGAPSTTTSVTLSSTDSSVASVPASVTVPAGSTSATFTITTSQPRSTTTVTISATKGGVTKMATLTVRGRR